MLLTRNKLCVSLRFKNLFFQKEHLCEKTNGDQLLENLLNYTTRDQKLQTELLKQLSCSHLVKREWFIISKVLELNWTFQSWSLSIREKSFDWPQLGPNIWKQDFLFPFYADDTILYISINRVKKRSTGQIPNKTSIVPLSLGCNVHGELWQKTFIYFFCHFVPIGNKTENVPTNVNKITTLEFRCQLNVWP